MVANHTVWNSLLRKGITFLKIFKTEKRKIKSIMNNPTCFGGCGRAHRRTHSHTYMHTHTQINRIEQEIKEKIVLVFLQLVAQNGQRHLKIFIFPFSHLHWTGQLTVS